MFSLRGDRTLGMEALSHVREKQLPHLVRDETEWLRALGEIFQAGLDIKL